MQYFTIPHPYVNPREVINRGRLKKVTPFSRMRRSLDIYNGRRMSLGILLHIVESSFPKIYCLGLKDQIKVFSAIQPYWYLLCKEDKLRFTAVTGLDPGEMMKTLNDGYPEM